MPQNKFFNGIAQTAAVVTISLLGSIANAPEADITNPNDHDSDTKNTTTHEPPPLAIFFGKEGDELPDGAKEQIKDIAAYLIETGDTFEIRGCSDPKGNDSSNFALSYRRMGSVRNELKQYNIPEEQYKDLYGDGEDCPTLTDGEPDTIEQARRAEFILNPVYEQPAPPSGDYTIFDLFKDMTDEEDENTPNEPGM
ncbi:MAG: OmpA family protein [Alphaproteobacteria bacterium]